MRVNRLELGLGDGRADFLQCGGLRFPHRVLLGFRVMIVAQQVQHAMHHQQLQLSLYGMSARLCLLSRLEYTR